ncbi:MAG: nucleotide sugar dehydrogenase, partial [Chloroflexi bacterium]|nr:nucleotide sugar dehydrogenase [Chloroflexota bacterium]
VKLAENTYRDVNIALANTLANISESVGVSAWDVIEMANLHPRVNIHRPGPGVGGHCIPVDPWFLVAADEASSRLIRTAREVNDGQPEVMAKRALELAGDARRAHVAVLGAAYKPGVSDARESPTSRLAEILIDAGVSVAVHDPWVREFAPELAASVWDAVSGADVIIVMVGHAEYQQLDSMEVAANVRGRRVLDTCNVLDREPWIRAGFEFYRYGEPA